MTDGQWTLLVHGGASRLERGNLEPASDRAARAGLGAALDAGAAVLGGGGGALDAVEAAVRVLEDDPAFNAGHGAALTAEGTVELDAAVMDGTRAAGAVAGVARARHPVSLARAVMAHGRHVLLSGSGADAFGAEMGLEQVDPDWFVLPERRRQLDEMRARGHAFDIGMKYGTVGAVARDAAGNVAAATSTGGVMGQRWGRIGDSPVIGAGTWADARSCAISCTGAGEYFLRAGVAHEIEARVRLAGVPLAAAIAAVLGEVRASGGIGGVIAAGAGGEAAWHFTTPGMYRGRVTSAGARTVAVYGDE